MIYKGYKTIFCFRQTDFISHGLRGHYPFDGLYVYTRTFVMEKKLKDLFTKKKRCFDLTPWEYK